MTVHALIPAAGRGVRAGGALPKQLREVAGRPLVAWAVSRLRAAGVASCVVAAPADLLDAVTAALADEHEVSVVVGGHTRQESVALALQASSAAPTDWIAVHDAARAAVHPDDVAAAFAVARDSDGAVLGRGVTDTVKRLEGGHVVATVDRATLFRAETPQVFRRELLERALARAAADGFVGTDESSLVERLPGIHVVAVTACFPNPKVTFASDLGWVESLLAATAAPDGAVAPAPGTPR
ncbi:MAG TPA: 2-C-methyl-D-erythritol 4-phosphate cytidylyltransferase [Thermoanaerobaculia bacterium]|nr:2-C-methyl-D-erythritol 4-phosphate cytidylyltransferase [Thermoanaerobaculia bacterium]